MSLTPSNMLPLGTRAPEFSLIDTISGKTISLGDVQSDVATVIFFICNHCPYVKHIRHALTDAAKKYQARGIRFVAISSNDIQEYPEDNPAQMREVAKKLGYSFPFLYDESQSVAKAYQAACTPDLYVFDKNLSCVYRGRFDESTPGNNKPVTGKDLSDALDALLAGKPINTQQMPSIGCNIKWKK